MELARWCVCDSERMCGKMVSLGISSAAGSRERRGIGVSVFEVSVGGRGGGVKGVVESA